MTVYYSADSEETAQQTGVPGGEPGPSGGDGHVDRAAVKPALVVLVVAALVLGGLWWWEQAHAERVEEGDCVVGLDLTVLIDDPDTALDETEHYRELYLSWTREILHHCADRGVTRVRAFAIAGDTVRQDREMVRADFERFDDAADLDSQREQRRAELEEVVLPRVEALLASELEVAGTDIVGAVTLTRQNLRSAEDVDYRRAWLLTDGVHNGAYSVHVLRLDGREAARQEVEGLVDDEHLAAGGLTGVEVQMLGAGRGGVSAKPVTNEQWAIVRAFWEELFAVTGADLDYLTDGPEL